ASVITRYITFEWVARCWTSRVRNGYLRRTRSASGNRLVASLAIRETSMTPRRDQPTSHCARYEGKSDGATDLFSFDPTHWSPWLRCQRSQRASIEGKTKTAAKRQRAMANAVTWPI